MKYTLYDNNGYIKGSGYSNVDDANRIAQDNGWDVIETETTANHETEIVDVTGTPTVRVATAQEQANHPARARRNEANIIRGRLRDDRDNRGRDGMPQLADSINDVLMLLNLNDE